VLIFTLIGLGAFGPLPTYEQRRKLKSSPYSVGEKFEYGYSSTVHLSQGSEYNNGIYFEEYLNPDINHRLNYVGASRFRNFLIYVKKRPSYY
jgi:ATP-dependent exoDNAse (exonuclease V) alpha subunit